MAKKLITVDDTTFELPSTAKYSSGSEIEKQVDARLSTKQDKGSYVLTNDSRLSDTRTPKTHSHAISEVTGLQTAIDGKQDKGNYVLTNDARLTDTRTPKSHTHAITDVTGLQAKITELEGRLAALETPAG